MANKRPLVNNAGTTGEVASGDVMDPATLGTGTPGAGTFLRGDGTWVTGKIVYVSATAPSNPQTNDLWVDIS